MDNVDVILRRLAELLLDVAEREFTSAAAALDAIPEPEIKRNEH